MSGDPRVRSAKAVAERLLLLASTCAVAAEASLRYPIVSWLKEEGIWQSISPLEKTFLETAKPDLKEEIQYSWGAEAVYVLGWALGIIPNLESPAVQASTRDILDQIPAPADSTDSFLRGAALRPAGEIHSAAENLCNAH